LFGLRGSNLEWGIQTLLSSLDPNLAQHAAKISEAVLHHPLISDSSLSDQPDHNQSWLARCAANLKSFLPSSLLRRFKLAAAIRKEELTQILSLLANPPVAAGAAPPAESWRVALATALNGSDSQANQVLQLAAPELKKLFPGAPAKADELISRMTSAAGDFSQDAEKWFESVMDRVSQRFALKMRVWTVVFSVIVAFALHLDAFALFRRISTDTELRSRLVASADALTRKADEIIATSTTNAPAAVYVEAMKQLRALHTKELARAPGGFSDLAGGERWLSNELATSAITNVEPWFRQYESLVPGAKLSVAADNFHSLLNDKLALGLVPDRYPELSTFWKPSLLHFWGTAASAVLLSLGAPFWFNLLKSLSNLRPILANKAQKETEKEKE